MSSKLFRAVLHSTAVSAAFAVAPLANAQPIVYFDRPTFVGALGTTQSNDLNAIADGGTTISFGTLGTGTLTGATVTGGRILNPNASGTPYTFSITFSQAINAFGADFSFVTTAAVGGRATFTFFNGATQVGVQAGYNSGTFVGAFATNPTTNLTSFNRVQISEVPIPGNGATTFATVDNLVVGVVSPTATVPEPATVALFATGLVAVAGIARRKRTRG